MKNKIRWVSFFLILFLSFYGNVSAITYDGANPDRDIYNRENGMSRITGASGKIDYKYIFSFGGRARNGVRYKYGTAEFGIDNRVSRVGANFKHKDNEDSIYYKTGVVASKDVGNTEGYKSKIINGGYSARYYNVGTYNGKLIDVLATVVDYRPYTDYINYNPDVTDGEKINGKLVKSKKSYIAFEEGIAISALNIEYITLKLTFYENNTNNIVKVAGNTTYWDVDVFQGVILDGNSQIYIDSDVKRNGSIQLYSNKVGGKLYVFNHPYGGGAGADMAGEWDHDSISYYDCPHTNSPCAKSYAFTEVFDTSETNGTLVRTISFGRPRTNSGLWGRPAGGYVGFGKTPVDDILPPKYGYSMDMACANCTGDFGITDNKAYVFQDTFDWDAIFNSDNITSSSITSATSACDNLKSHFKKTSKIYCREEYYIYFPTKSDADATKIESGRYFTLNELSVVADVPDFNPVRIKKIRECRSKDNTGLQSFNTSNSLRNSDMGKLYVSFEENGRVYSFNDQELTKKNTPNYYSTNISGNVLKQEIEYSYTLPPDFYRYVNKADGKVIKQMTPEILAKKNFNDLGVSTLPISFKGNTAAVTFKYKPSSRMQKYGSNNKGLNCYNDTESNIYKIIEGKNGELPKTACYKLFSNSSQRNTCVSNNKVSTTTSCLYKNSYLAKRQNASSQDFYKCTLKSEDTACNENNYTRYSRDWNPVKNVCCSYGEKYYPGTGECFADTDVLCEQRDGKYYYKGVQVTEEEWRKYCDRDCPENFYLCPDGTCSRIGTDCPPQVDLNNIIYRVIDNNSPFIGQKGLNRNTGINWCGYDVTTNLYKCDYDNYLVKRVITRNQTIYRSDHILYRATLNSESIKQIREYNKKNSYGDWDLMCLDENVCFSNFLDRYGDITGACAGNFSDTFYNCVQ